MNSIDRVIKQFNNDYSLLESNIKQLIHKNNKLKIYSCILISVICILTLVLVLVLIKLFY